MTIKNDYRNTSYCLIDYKLNSKKIEYSIEFRENHPRATNMYNIISEKNSMENRKFREIYFERCAYCGVSTQVIDSSKFEVDHFIPKSILKQMQTLESLKKLTTVEINDITNLVCSCQMCNRGKSGFICNEENAIYLLHPDNNFLNSVFYRQFDYSIEVFSEYKDNIDVKQFYKYLKFDNQIKRLDYLLMEMKDFCEKYKEEQIINNIQRAILRLESKRRNNY